MPGLARSPAVIDSMEPVRPIPNAQALRCRTVTTGNTSFRSFCRLDMSTPSLIGVQKLVCNSLDGVKLSLSLREMLHFMFQ